MLSEERSDEPKHRYESVGCFDSGANSVSHSA